MKVKDVLAVKGSEVITIDHQKSIFDALSTFAAHRVGSLLVLDFEGRIVGIIAARDVLMQVLNNCETLTQVKVQDIMTKNIIIGAPDDDLNYIQTVMTENRIRHLPIIESNKLVGIVSIGDVVKAQLKETHVENHYLKEFIIGKYPA